MTPMPSISAISDRPGPEVAVAARAPVNPAPRVAEMAAISSSVCSRRVPCLGISLARRSMMEVAGVIG